MIYAATIDDIDGIIVMGRSFFGESGFENEAQFDEDSFRQTCINLLANGCIFVSKHGDKYAGMISGLAYPFYFNAAHKTAQELFWWVSPEFRGGISAMRLLRAFEAWAKAQGCMSISMISLPSLVNSPAALMYQKSGYRASEQSFIRSL